MKAKFIYESLDMLKPKSDDEIRSGRELFFQLHDWAKERYVLQEFGGKRQFITSNRNERPLFGIQGEDDETGMTSWSFQIICDANDLTHMLVYPPGIYNAPTDVIKIESIEDLQKAINKYKEHILEA